MNRPDDLINTVQVVALLGFKAGDAGRVRLSVIKLFCPGFPVHKKIGGRDFYVESEIIDWLQQHDPDVEHTLASRQRYSRLGTSDTQALRLGFLRGQYAANKRPMRASKVQQNKQPPITKRIRVGEF